MNYDQTTNAPITELTDLDINTCNSAGCWWAEVKDDDGNVFTGTFDPVDFAAWCKNINDSIEVALNEKDEAVVIVRKYALKYGNSTDFFDLDNTRIKVLDNIKDKVWGRMLGMDLGDAVLRFLKEAEGFDNFDMVCDDDDNNETFADFLREAHAAYDDRRKM
jgi:hypothetical protein